MNNWKTKLYGIICFICAGISAWHNLEREAYAFTYWTPMISLVATGLIGWHAKHVDEKPGEHVSFHLWWIIVAFIVAWVGIEIHQHVIERINFRRYARVVAEADAAHMRTVAIADSFRRQALQSEAMGDLTNASKYMDMAFGVDMTNRATMLESERLENLLKSNVSK
jgi:hypothetical protein